MVAVAGPGTSSVDDFRRRHALDVDPDEKLIKFIGVWDTVDAVGLPVDELSTMVDRLFYPHRFPDQELSRKVERACHAIAVDDERHTFHPVLWNRCGTADSSASNRSGSRACTPTSAAAIPTALASVSLCWMIGKVRFEEERGEGLRFDPEQLCEFEQRRSRSARCTTPDAGSGCTTATIRGRLETVPRRGQPRRDRRAQDPPRRLQTLPPQHGRLYATRPAYLVPAGRCARADLETQSRDL